MPREFLQLPDAKEPAWVKLALEKMSSKDRRAIEFLRTELSRLGSHQEWYYAGAGADGTPLIFTPNGAHHQWVDRAYWRGDKFFGYYNTKDQPNGNTERLKEGL